MKQKDKNNIQIEEKPLNVESRYYLKQSLRSSQIPKAIQAEIDCFGSIQNMSGDDNCGIYSVMEGLYQNSIEFNEDVDIFRR